MPATNREDLISKQPIVNLSAPLFELAISELGESLTKATVHNALLQQLMCAGVPKEKLLEAGVPEKAVNSTADKLLDLAVYQDFKDFSEVN